MNFKLKKLEYPNIFLQSQLFLSVWKVLELEKQMSCQDLYSVSCLSLQKQSENLQTFDPPSQVVFAGNMQALAFEQK